MTTRFEIRRSGIGRRRWRVALIGENGEVLTLSEHLTSRAACHKNIAATITAAKHAPIVDTTR